MSNLIDKSALVAEIENIRKHYIERDDFDNGWNFALDKIISLVDTLEVKEGNLEEKATQLSQKYFPDEENVWARANIEAQNCKSACIEMVEWLKAQKGEEV